MLSQTVIDLIISGVTVALSVITSAFVSGMRWGAMRTDIEYIKRDLETIKSMFVLTIRSTEAMKDK